MPAQSFQPSDSKNPSQFKAKRGAAVEVAASNDASISN